MGKRKANDPQEEVISPEEVDEVLDDYIAEPPDGRWGWVIVASSLVCNIIVDGIGYTFGIFFLEFVRFYDAPKSKVALVGSLQVGMYLCVGPVVSALTNRYGCRPVCIAGSLLATAGFLLSTFSPSIDILILTYGVIGGIGFGMIYLPAIVSVGFYFEKKRAIATGIGVCGSGVGMFIFAPLSRYLLDTFAWRSAILILAGIVFNGVVCGALMKPLKAKKRKVSKSPTSDMCAKGTTPQSFLLQDYVSNTEYTRSVPNIVISSVGGGSNTVELGMDPKAPLKTSVERITLIDDKDIGPDGLTSAHLKFVDVEHKISENKQRHLDSNNRPFISEANLNKLKVDLARPMYRKDIFYSGSIMNFPEFRAQPDMKSYIKSVTSIVSEREPEDLACFRCLPPSARSILSDMLNVKLFKNVTFLLICLGNILAMLGFYVPFVYIADRAIRLGIEEQKAAFLLSIIGITNTVGRVLTGFLADLHLVDSLVINNVAMVILGVSTIMAPFCDTYGLLCLFAAVFGLCVAAYISLTSIIICDLLGLENLTNAFGLLTLARGVSSVIGPPIAGAVFDISENYGLSFYMGGSLMICGAMCHMVLHLPSLRKKAVKRNTNTTVVDD